MRNDIEMVTVDFNTKKSNRRDEDTGKVSREDRRALIKTFIAGIVTITVIEMMVLVWIYIKN